MSPVELGEALGRLRPGVAFTFKDADYSTIVLDDKNSTLPTLEEIEANISANSYAEKRRLEYPTLMDQLDAIWKGGSDLETMKERILEIKAKYPKV